MDFVHLHVHTEYSLLDGANRIDKLVQKVKDTGMKAVAITDHGVMYGAISFYKECIKQSIKPIIGCEMYMASRTLVQKEAKIDEKYCHLILLAKNNTGYKNLIKLVSIGFLEGFYYKPRIDRAVLTKYSEGLIGLSACIGGEIPQLILNGEYEKAKKLAIEYNEIFEQDSFYLELQFNGIEEQLLVNQKLLQISNETGIPVVATNDAHYLNKEDAYAHQVLMCIQTNKKITDEDKMEFPTDEFYVKTPEEIYENFKNIPQALENTNKIADMCNISFEFDKFILPEFNVPMNQNHYEYFRDLCYKKAKDKFLNEKDFNAVLKRLNYEIDVINKMGFIDYFLIVSDFVEYSKKQDIPVSCRGSAAGSLVAFVLDISNINPLKYDLLFERFLNPERITMPDIDIDFCYERRGEVIKYVNEKYGEDKVAQIITFGTMAARAAIRDTGRVLDIQYAKVDSIAKMIPMDKGITIQKALTINNELKKFYDNEDDVKRLIDISMLLEGLPRHASTHAAGVVITKNPVDTYVPLIRSDGNNSTQFTMTELEDLGLLKMDFLGLRTLTVIKDTVDLIKKYEGIDIKFGDDFSDKKVFKLLSEGKTDGVFQFESPGMKQFLKELKPNTLEDMIAAVSLYRPGPMDQISRYIKNKQNPEKIEYTHESLESLLNVTYGCMVYQEQVMKIVQELAGYSLSRADLVRRAMSKKKFDVMERERHNFIYGIKDELGNVVVPGAVKNGVDEKSADTIFDEILNFANYAFNKSHAASYAVIAYQTAYLKANYGVYFMASLVNSFMGNLHKIPQYIYECGKMGIKLLPPDINKSNNKFTIENGNIRFGLGSIKNVGSEYVKELIKIRENREVFIDFLDFANKLTSETKNKKAIESLIKAGAFDSISKNRIEMLKSFEYIIDSIFDNRRNNLDGQLDLFGNIEKPKKIEITNNINSSNDIGSIPKKQLLIWEKEATGVYISGNPLDEFKSQIDSINPLKSIDILLNEENTDEEKQNKISQYDNKTVVYIGIINSKKLKTTKNNQMMAFIDVEDIYGSIEVVVFPKVYNSVQSILTSDAIVKIIGKVQLSESDSGKIIADKIEILEKQSSLYIRFINKNEQIENKVIKILNEHLGDKKVYFYYNDTNIVKLAPKELWVKDCEDLVGNLKKIVGEDNVKIK